MTGELSHIAARVTGQPLLIMPTKLGVIAQVLAGRIGLNLEAPELGAETPSRPTPLASRFVGSRFDNDTRKALPYVRTESGVAILTITGSLVNRGAWIGANSGLTSYEGIAAQIRAALDDPKVSSILLDIDSPGGEATGAFELADFIQAAGAKKQITAFVNGLAASAGYLIASGAQKIVSIPSGVTGSIGVVMMHADYSRMLDKAGITPTFIFSGDHKVDANPYEPLSQAVRDGLKAEVDQMREAFVQMVAKGRRGRISAKGARDTQARTYTGTEAKNVGLVDEIATFDTLFNDLNRKATSSRPAGRGQRSPTMEIDQDTRPAATGERDRIKSILTHAEAKGREASAQHLAFQTDMTPEAAAQLLSTMAKTSSLHERAMGSERGIHTAGTDRVRHEVKIDAAAIYAARNEPCGFTRR